MIKDDMNMYNKLSNKLFYIKEKNENGTIENKEGIIKIIGDDKVLCIMNYFYQHTDRRNRVQFTLVDLITECGFKPKTGEGKTNEKFLTVLNKLIELNAIELNTDIDKIKPKDLVKGSVLIDLSNSYVELLDEEYDNIMNYTDKKIDNLKLLTLYMDIKGRMFKRPKGDCVTKDGGKPESCYPSYIQICKDINITEGKIKEYLDILWDLNLIRYNRDETLKYYLKKDKNKILKYIPNIYVLYQDEWENELKESKKYYKLKNDDKVFIKTEEDNNDRSRAGKKGNVIRAIKEDRATEEDLEKLKEINEIEDTISGKNDIKFKNQYLLEKNEGMTLSDIYADRYKENLADDYYDLEVKLELINEETNEMLVDYDYYKWVMVNYKEEDHQYYVNCINKHKKENIEVRKPFSGFYNNIKKNNSDIEKVKKPFGLDNNLTPEEMADKVF
jgi:hypothetical protein